MANKVNNIYTELFESLPIPERLEPQNIEAMLRERMALNAVPADSSSKRSIEVTSGGKRRNMTAFRSVASVAACAALAFGIAGYAGVFDSDLPTDNTQQGGAYASDYDDVHRTFTKYYVDDKDKKTLDSVIEDIDHSYNETQHPNTPTVTQPATEDNTPDPELTNPVGPEVPDNVEPGVPAVPVEPEQPSSENIDDIIPLPENDAAEDENKIVFGSGFVLVQDENMIRIIRSNNGKIEYTGNIFPVYQAGTSKTLVDFYAEGTKVTAVYSVVTSDSYVANDTPSDSFVDGLLDNLYGSRETVSNGAGSRSSVEVCIYDINNGIASLASDVIQSGSLVDMKYGTGAIYLVTAYHDYRVAPIVGVDDLESYVPSYTVNGEKFYVDAQNIMLPDYIATTDYTVISGITTNGGVSMQAVLGYEGRVLLKNSAVYLFGYDTSAGADMTCVKVFSLANGEVIYAGYKEIDGIALGGDGIASFGNAIAVTTVVKEDDGYKTILGIYDGTMNIVSRVKLAGALTTVHKVGSRIYLSNASESYGIDLSDPAVPDDKIPAEPAKDHAEGLVEFDGGYVTLTKDAGGDLILSKITKNAGGELRLDFKTTVYSGSGVSSKAIENNGVLFVSGNIVGVPYGFFDGLDYCYRYALYHTSAAGFEKLGEIEVHETDEVFENGRAVLGDGHLYIFSEGRVYAAAIGDGLNIVGSADIVESAYSGHAY